VALLLAISIKWTVTQQHNMAISNIGAATSAVPKSAPVKLAHPPAAASTQTAPASSPKKHHPQAGHQGHLVNKLA
jgi:hypothetical protein